MGVDFLAATRLSWYEGKYYIVALKDHVNLGFAIKGLSEKELDLFEGKGKILKEKAR